MRLKRHQNQWLNWLGMLVALFLVFDCSAVFAKMAHWQDKRYIESSFYDIALRSEYDRISPVVRKWKQPLNIWISSSAGDPEQQRRLLAMHFTHLGDITNLPFKFVDEREKANVRVFFTGEKQLKETVAREMSAAAAEYMQNSMCLGKIRFNRNAEITRGTVVIPVERVQAQGKLVPCIVEELTQMLGLINDSKIAFPTVFSDVTDNQLLTGLDYLLLKLLYAPQMRSGMNVYQVVPILRRHLIDWERTGVIRNAEVAITDGPLYSFTDTSHEHEVN